MKTIFSVLLILFATAAVFGQSVTLMFDNTPSFVNVNKAALKYNKDFALSFTYDDGLAPPIEFCFAIQNGGIAKDGINYPGLFYTDGCGNDIPFTSALAYFSLASNLVDLHSGLHSQYFSWNQLVDVYNGGWDAINHQYSGNGTAGTAEIVDNDTYTFNQTSALGTPIKLTHFVIPAGQSGWISPAFNSGVKSIHNESNSLDGYQFNIGGCWQCTVGGSLGFQVDTVNTVTEFLLTREYRDHNDPYPGITDYIDQIAAKSINGDKFWFSEFTHGVGIGGVGGGVDWDDLKPYLQYLESTYGKSGSDRIIYASVQEIWEYIHMRINTDITSSLNGNLLTINLDTSSCDKNLRRYHLTLLIDSDEDFSVVSSNGIENYSAKTSGNDRMLNLFINSSVHHNSTTGVIKKGNPKLVNRIYFSENGLSISFKNTSAKNINLFDVNGKVVFSSASNQLNFEQNLSIPKGVYFYEIQDLESGDVEKGKRIKVN